VPRFFGAALIITGTDKGCLSKDFSIHETKMTSTEEIFHSYNFYVCMVVLYIAGTVASAGGIGGGGVNVPLLLVIGGYSYHEAVVFSLCTVLGNHCAQSFINWPLSHPFVKMRPLIYWEILLFLLPAQLGGSNIGVLISDIFPEVLLLSCALVVLLLAIAKTYYKGMKFFREERRSISNKSVYQKLVNFATEIENSRMSSLQENSMLINVIGGEGDLENDENIANLSPRRESDTSTVALFNPINRNNNSYHLNVDNSMLSANDFDFTVTNNTQQDDTEDETEHSLLNDEENRENTANHKMSLEGPSVQHQSSLSNASYSSSPGVVLENLPLSQPSTSLSKDPKRRRSSNNSHNSSFIRRQLPVTILQLLLFIFLCYVGFFLILQYTFKSCTQGYFILIGAIYLPLCAFIYWSMNLIKDRQLNNPIYYRVKGDIDMEKQSVLLVGLTFLVGILSSLLGIGGGELMGPLLLSYHLLPAVSTATTSMLSLMNTGNNIIHYAIAGEFGVVLSSFSSVYLVIISAASFFSPPLFFFVRRHQLCGRDLFLFRWLVCRWHGEIYCIVYLQEIQ
jgi:uncharacterized membrane protein YfcA